MTKIVFKNLEKSELAKEAVNEHINSVTSRFPDLKRAKLVVTLSMHNSQFQAGPDLFSVKFHCRNGKYRGVILEKEADNLYKALAEMSEALLERLNRFGDKERVKEIKKARKFAYKAKFLDFEESAS